MGFSAELAQAYGLINRALPADQPDDQVERIATRVASLEEAHPFNVLSVTSDAQESTAASILNDAQTREVELDLDSVLAQL